jgi:hypothetical protein
MDIPEEFWSEFTDRLRKEAAMYSPVAINRLYPFLVSRFPNNMVEKVLSGAVARGIIAIRINDKSRFLELKEKAK